MFAASVDPIVGQSVGSLIADHHTRLTTALSVESHVLPIITKSLTMPIVFARGAAPARVAKSLDVPMT